MRLTVNVGLVCITVMLVSTVKWFLAPYALQKQHQEFVLNMIMLGGTNGRLPLRPPLQHKIIYDLSFPAPAPPLPSRSPDPNDPPE